VYIKKRYNLFLKGPCEEHICVFLRESRNLINFVVFAVLKVLNGAPVNQGVAKDPYASSLKIKLT